jgi:hypothetical protein
MLYKSRKRQHFKRNKKYYFDHCVLIGIASSSVTLYDAYFSSSVSICTERLTRTVKQFMQFRDLFSSCFLLSTADEYISLI